MFARQMDDYQIGDFCYITNYPYVNVTGLSRKARLAKKKTMANLDVKRNSILLKIDVAFPEHPHLIGKRGDNIQNLARSTGCQIHFPDSNKNNATEKNNQVSISGQPKAVESVRAEIRKSLSLTFVFDSFYYIRSDYSMAVERVRELFNIMVQVTQPKIAGVNNGTWEIVVRGSENHSHNVINGVEYLLKSIVVPQTNEIRVTIVLHIAPQHHGVVQSQCRVQGLESRTGTEIIFPDVDPRRPSIENSPVRISGSVYSVYNARKEILNFLPALMTFELDEHHPFSHGGFAAKETHYNDILINIKYKNRDGKSIVSIKGTEGKISDMHSIRRHILDKNGEGLFPFSRSNAVAIPLNTRGFGHEYSRSMPSRLGSQNTLPESRRFASGGCNIGSSFSLSLPESQSLVFPRSSMNHQFQSDQGFYSGPSSASTSSVSSPALSPCFGTPNDFSLSTISERRSAFSHYGSESRNNVVNVGLFGNESLRTSTPSVFSRAENTTSSLNLMNEALEKLSLFEALEKPEIVDLDDTLTDVTEKRLLASKAMQKRIPKAEPGIPNANWCGFGFSASMPSSENWRDQNRLHFEQNGSPSTENETSWINTNDDHPLLSPDNGFMNTQPKVNYAASNFLDSKLIHETALSKCTTVDEFLEVLGLSVYADKFHQQEIEFPWIFELTEDDLRELGIDKMGPRRKIALAIKKMISMKENSSNAVGAERKFKLF